MGFISSLQRVAAEMARRRRALLVEDGADSQHLLTQEVLKGTC
jgi:hypothetical protein